MMLRSFRPDNRISSTLRTKPVTGASRPGQRALMIIDAPAHPRSLAPAGSVTPRRHRRCPCNHLVDHTVGDLRKILAERGSWECYSPQPIARTSPDSIERDHLPRRRQRLLLRAPGKGTGSARLIPFSPRGCHRSQRVRLGERAVPAGNRPTTPPPVRRPTTHITAAITGVRR
jgi:hypothetical protein